MGVGSERGFNDILTTFSSSTGGFPTTQHTSPKKVGDFQLADNDVIDLIMCVGLSFFFLLLYFGRDLIAPMEQWSGRGMEGPVIKRHHDDDVWGA